MVAIVNRRPKTLGILELLDAFISHKKEVVTLRTKFDLDASLHSIHVVEGFIKALDILDEIVALIRKSKNKADAIENLMKEFTFSKIQAEAIVNMQLYKLTNTDVTLLKEEYERLKTLITRLKEILENEEVLKSLMKDELREIKKEYATPRITEIKEEKTEIKIDEVDMVSKEDFIVCISKSGYIKKVSIKSYNASNEEDTTLKEGDYLEGLYKVNNLDTILIFTNMGNYLYLPVYQIDE
jgi:topoisomerase-4 subunit A